jgi:hypothetical protein
MIARTDVLQAGSFYNLTLLDFKAISDLEAWLAERGLL